MRNKELRSLSHFLTEMADIFSNDIQHHKKYSMNEHIAKPIDMVQLMQILSNYLL